jgi:hypothetical protein
MQVSASCPCLYASDIKCPTSNDDGAAYVCVRGGQGCASLEPALALGGARHKGGR